MKKVIIIISVLIILLGAGGLYWMSMQGPRTSSDPIDAIPVSATLVVSYPDLSRAWGAFVEKDYHEMLVSLKPMEHFFARNMMLIRHDADVKKALGNAVQWSSYHTTAADSLAYFHVLKPTDGSTERVMEALKGTLSGKGTFSQQNLGETTVLKMVSGPDRTTYFAMKNGLILSSSELELIKASIDQLSNGTSLRNNPDFRKAVDAAGKNVDANLFVNFKKLPSHLKRTLRPDRSELATTVENFASWMELDMNMKSDGFTFNGFSYCSDSLPEYLGLFLNQTPQDISFPDVLPSNTASFLFFGISDAISFSSSYRALLQKTGKLDDLEAELDSLNELYGIDIEQNILGWLGNSFGICITEPARETFAENSYLVMHTKSSELADKLLSDLCTAVNDVTGKDAEPHTVNGMVIHRFPLSGLMEKLFGSDFATYGTPHYVIIDDHVVFGVSAASLASYLQFVQADRTLGKELAFSRFAENLGSTFNIFSYNQIKRSEKILNAYLNTDSQDALWANPTLIRNFEALGMQVTSTGSSFYSSVFLKYNPNATAVKETSWKATIPGGATIAPVFVRNHVSGEAEILVQDSSNAVYLFNVAGQQLFRTKIAEPIRSRPTQVDAFKNGKLQYVFNTENYIYLIDRDGNVVDGYPIKLPASAITDLAVFDYDNDKDYRLLITCSNKHIYNFDIKGKRVNGWRHNSASDPTIHPFQHLLVSQKDYLITGESNGKIHLLDRTGKNRVTVQDRVDASKNNRLQVFKSTEAAFTGVYITDTQGRIHRISLDGEVKPMDLGKFSPEHHFLVSDLDKDGKPEFIFSDLNMLQVFNYKKQKLFEQRIDPSATVPFIMDMGTSGKGIGYCFEDPEQLIVYDHKGQVKEGFPLSGKSVFDVFRSEQDVFVVTMATDSTLSIQAIRY